MNCALLVIDVQVGIIDHIPSYNKDQVLANIRDVTLAGDGHTTIDNDLLKAEQIIAHHNRALNGFSSGKYAVNVKPANEIDFQIL
jgi:nicotinamidase-related amidase